MIRFSCPSCKTVLSVTAEQAGTKLGCPCCGQRLQVPQPPAPRPQDKTVLGALLPENVPTAPRPAASPAPTAPPQVQSWFYMQSGGRAGPVPWGQLQQMAASGQLQPSDLVWTNGMASWLPASAVTGLIRPPTVAPVAAPVSPATHPSPAAPSRSNPEVLPGPTLVKKPSPVWRRRLPLVAGAATVMVAAVVFLVILLNRGKKTEKEPGNDKDQADRELGTEELVARCKPGVALLRGSAGFGTGFLAQPKMLVTNAHVIELELLNKVQIRFPGEGSERVTVAGKLIYEDRQRDLAIFRIDLQREPLRLAADYKLKAGQQILIIGNPGATAAVHNVTLDSAVTQGLMSTETFLDGRHFYQMSVAVNPGNSGGPVFDTRGRVIGVVTRKAVGRREEGLGFAIPVADLTEALRRAEQQTADDEDRTVLGHNLAAAFRRLAKAGKLRGAILIVCAESIRESVLDGGSADAGFRAGLRSLRSEFREEMKRSDSRLEEMEDVLPILQSSKLLSAD
ncbi:MAG TPA: trypsin-like peptidase domain-containing protein, partial [Gemmataceae bacterium]|nr:trypsin-like peptidase domain-containing protein [Gemmataceae bacterium]